MRLISPALLFLYRSLFASVSVAAATVGSKVGGVPLTVWHGKYGPGLEFRYQSFQSTVGGVIEVTVESSGFAHTLSLKFGEPAGP